MVLSTLRNNPQYTGGDVDAYYGHQSQTFESLGVKEGVTVPELAKVLGMYPLNATEGGHDGDGLWVRNYGERLPLRGGSLLDSAGAGVFALDFDGSRSNSWVHVGFRAAFVNL